MVSWALWSALGVLVGLLAIETLVSSYSKPPSVANPTNRPPTCRPSPQGPFGRGRRRMATGD